MAAASDLRGRKTVADPKCAKETIVRKPLFTAILQRAKKVGKIEIKEIEFHPGQKTGVHLHPCPVVGYIAEGSAVIQIEGRGSETLKAGDAFFEPANVKMLRFDNASNEAGMKFIAFYLLGEEERELIRMLE
jgi:quercetin dioxygenase-like cupin family protein